MTTLIGIKAVDDSSTIILAADTQITIEEETELTAKYKSRKIFAGDCWALAYRGAFDSNLNVLVRDLERKTRKEPEEIKRMFETMLDSRYRKDPKHRYLDQINHINRALRRNGNEMGDMREFLLAVNHPSMGLYYVDEYGNIKDHVERDDERTEDNYLVLSGDNELVSKLIAETMIVDQYDRKPLTRDRAIDIAYRAMQRARSDMTTGGYVHIVEIGRNYIKDHLGETTAHMDRAEEEDLDRIKNWKSPETEEEPQRPEKE